MSREFYDKPLSLTDVGLGEPGSDKSFTSMPGFEPRAYVGRFNKDVTIPEGQLEKVYGHARESGWKDWDRCSAGSRFNRMASSAAELLSLEEYAVFMGELGAIKQAWREVEWLGGTGDSQRSSLGAQIEQVVFDGISDGAVKEMLKGQLGSGGSVSGQESKRGGEDSSFSKKSSNSRASVVPDKVEYDETGEIKTEVTTWGSRVFGGLFSKQTNAKR